jgi:hypothetical protein
MEPLTGLTVGDLIWDRGFPWTPYEGWIGPPLGNGTGAETIMVYIGERPRWVWADDKFKTSKKQWFDAFTLIASTNELSILDCNEIFMTWTSIKEARVIQREELPLFMYMYRGSWFERFLKGERYETRKNLLDAPRT